MSGGFTRWYIDSIFDEIRECKNMDDVKKYIVEERRKLDAEAAHDKKWQEILKDGRYEVDNVNRIIRETLKPTEESKRQWAKT